jgi:hypothetical protein
VIYNTFPVQEVRHERLISAGGYLSGKLIAHHLAQARQVHVLLCSIGDSLERYAAEVWSSSAVYSLALDGVGSAAVEALANAACRRLEDWAVEQSWKSSIPLSPGMVDYSEEPSRRFSICSRIVTVSLSELIHAAGKADDGWVGSNRYNGSRLLQPADVPLPDGIRRRINHSPTAPDDY